MHVCARPRTGRKRDERPPLTDENVSESGFTIIELVVSLAILAIIVAPMASVFWAAIRTAGSAAHRTDGSSIASREIEGMRAVPYAQVGFYADQPGFASTFEGFTTVSLGPSSPATGALIPQMQPLTPDPSAATTFAPDPNPANASPIMQGGVKFTVTRNIVWTDAKDASTTFTGAYKRLTVVVTWTDGAGAHTVRQDSLLYPGGQGQYAGPMGGATTTTSTTAAPGAPDKPVLAPITPLASPADQTQAALAWTQPGGTAATSYTIEYSTDPGFPPGNFAVVANLAPSVTSYTVTSLTPNTLYYFEILAYAGTANSTSNVQSVQTAPLPAPVCTLGGLIVAGASSLSTTGTRLTKTGRMSENLTLTLSTSGPCNDIYEVKAVDPTNAPDPSSPYVLSGSTGTFTSTIASFNAKKWAVGLHTFTVFDVTTNNTTSVIKTFKVCVNSAASC